MRGFLCFMEEIQIISDRIKRQLECLDFRFVKPLVYPADFVDYTDIKFTISVQCKDLNESVRLIVALEVLINIDQSNILIRKYDYSEFENRNIMTIFFY